MSKLIRISETTAHQLESLSKLTGESKQKLLDSAVTFFVYEQTLKKANEQYAVLKKNAQASKEIEEEREAWDHTLEDGLEND